MWIILIIVVLIIIGLLPEKKNSNSKDNNKNHKTNYYNHDSAFYNNTGFGKNTVIKNLLIEKRGPYCEKCGEGIELQVDHIVPISRGGTNDLENLQLLCYKCHQERHHYEFSEIGNNDQKVTGKYKMIRYAIDRKEKLKIKYEDYSGVITERILLPKNIISKDGRNYLEAFCYLRNEDREFKISRIKQVTQEDEEYCDLADKIYEELNGKK